MGFAIAVPFSRQFAMPIKVTCQCGQSFAAKDELAGKTVKCPKCTKPLKIPEAGPRVAAPTAAATPQRAAPQPIPQQAGPQQPRAPQPGLGGSLPSAASAASLFDEAGIGQAAAGTLPCPSCGAALPESVVLCVKCGYNKRMGRRMETIRGSGTPLGGGHEATAEEMLERAARSIEEEKEEERKKTKEGMPWWAYLIGLGCCVGFMVTMMMLPPKVALMTGGVLIGGLASLINLYANIRIWIIAFTEGIGHGVGCLLCCFYQLYYIATRWDQCGGYFLMALGANVLGSLVQGALTLGLSVMEEEEEAAVDPPDPRPAAVAVAEPSWHVERLLQRAG
jgi:hypothetical protein